ncbi:MAG: alpha/beta hydrolase [Lachnospiraceae bacterium]|nr:alpha/beta hydrolase [Lachnospiraceae bacterium]
MNYKEYGTQNGDVIILLHGGGLSWWNYQEEAEILQNDYHVIIPILDGHAESDRVFTTIENNATEIISFIDEKFAGSVLMIGGLSLGGQILLDILSQRGNICQYAVIESALVVPSKFTYSMIKPAIGSCYGLIRCQWFSKMQFKHLRIKRELFDDYFRDTCGITKQNMISFLQSNSQYSLKDSIRSCSAKTFLYVGEKENHAMQTSAKIIHETLQGSSLQVLPQFYHGEFSINNANDYVNELNKIIGNC